MPKTLSRPWSFLTRGFQSTSPRPGRRPVRLGVEALEVRDNPAGDGLSAIYFDSASLTEAQNLQGATTATTVPNVNFNWGTGKPAGTPSSFGADTFAARFAGSVETTTGGTYTFRTYSDDGIRLWVDDKLVISNWTNHSPTYNTGSISLEAGRKYHIVLEYYENGGGAVAQLQWNKPGDAAGSYVAIPQANLYSDRRILPPNTGIVNVKDPAYGAKGDGKTDDWEAIQRAVSDYIYRGSGDNTAKFIYFPAGTYLVSKTIEWRKYTYATIDGVTQFVPNLNNSHGGWGGGLSFLGENRDNTVIKLTNNNPAFQDSPSYTWDANAFLNSNAVMYLASNKNASFNTTTGAGRDAYDNSILNLTVNTGVGNTGAVGIDYFVNNRSSMTNVRVLSQDGQGRVGVRSDRQGSYSGLISDVTVDGFNSGFQFGVTNDVEAFTVFDKVTVQNQLVQGVNITGGLTLTAQNFRSINSVPAIRITRNGLVSVTLIDSTAIGTGGASARSAIVNGVEDTTTGAVTGSGIANSVLVRNFITSGYKYAYAGQVNGTNTTRPNGTITELTSHGVNRSFTTAPSATLNLANKAAPDYFNTNPSDWVAVGAPNGTDDTATIQAAFDTAATNNKPVVYFQSNKRYTVKGTITIPANVRWVVGFGAELSTSGTAFGSTASPTPVFRVAANSSNPLILDTITFRLNGVGSYAVRHDTARTLVLRELNVRSSSQSGYYKAGSTAGELFIRDVSGGGYDFRPGQKVWGMQLDVAGIVNTGADVRLLGVRTEGGKTTATTQNGGRTEILGASLQINSEGSASPAFVNKDSAVSLTFMATNPGNNTFYPSLVDEYQNGVLVDQFLPTQATGTGSNGGRRVALYRT
jgi:hypothetical protein